ncbi:WD40-repeat-containing domain protein [Melanogaster broomeanus]|nr:WD40-repeat-containing domain protein [Melanogaster broomeanus]
MSPSFRSTSSVSTTTSSPSVDVSDEHDALPFEGHRYGIHAVAYSPDGKQIATGAADGLIIIWDSKTGSKIQQLQGHTDTVNAISFSRDGSRLVSGSDDHTLCIWDTTTGEPVGEKWEAHSDGVLTVNYAPDDETIASGGRDSLVVIWNAQGKMAIEITEHPNWVYCVMFSPDGTCLATACGDSNIRIFDVRTGTLVLRPLAGHTGYVTVVTYSPDGMQLASGSGDSTIRTWDTRTGVLLMDPLECHTDIISNVDHLPLDLVTRELVAGPLRRHYRPVIARYSPDGAHFVSAGADGCIRLWDATTREVILPLMTEVDKLEYAITGPFTGHTNYINDVAYFPDGMRVASAAFDSSIRIWDVQTGAQVKELAHSSGSLVLVNLLRWAAISQRRISLHHGVGLHDVASHASRSGRTFQFAGHRGELFIWNSQTGQPIKMIWQIIASGSEDATIRVRDVHNAETIAGPLEGHSGGVTSVAFLLDGKTIASVSADATLRVWDLELGKQPLGHLTPSSPTLYVRLAGFCSRLRPPISTPGRAPKVTLILVCSELVLSSAFPGGPPQAMNVAIELRESSHCPKLRAWRMGRRDHFTTSLVLVNLLRWAAISQRRISLHHGVGLHDVASRPSHGSFIATAGYRGELFIWNSQTGQHIKMMSGHDPAKVVFTVTFSPDGKRIASGSDDTTIRVWDVHHAETIAGPLEGHSGGVTSVAFSPDGKAIASVSADGTLRVWDLELGKVSLGPIEHYSYIHTVSYSPDGKTICTSSEDATISLWHATTGELILGPLRGHRMDVTSVAFSPDGHSHVQRSSKTTTSRTPNCTGVLDVTSS